MSKGKIIKEPWCAGAHLISTNIQQIMKKMLQKKGSEKISVEKLSRDFQLTMFWEASMLEKVSDVANCESKLVQPTSQVADSSTTLDME
ncbi:hypothetical protein ACET3Z_024800 [Daucus carota]